MSTVIDKNGRPEPPEQDAETPTLLGFLEFQRATLECKTAGLNDADLRRTVASSTMTLGGLLKHIAWVEDYWFTVTLCGDDWPEPWASVDWDARPDWEWSSALEDAADYLRALWRERVAAVRRSVALVIADHGLDAVGAATGGDSQSPSLRWMLVHMIEEYARRNGHADLIRESIDGSTGE